MEDRSRVNPGINGRPEDGIHRDQKGPTVLATPGWSDTKTISMERQHGGQRGGNNEVSRRREPKPIQRRGTGAPRRKRRHSQL